MAVKGLFSETFLPDFEALLGYPLPNGLVVSGVLGWLHAANDSMDRNAYVKIMGESFTDEEIDDAKKILVEIVMRQKEKDVIKSDKDLLQWVKGRNQPEKKKKQTEDIVNIFTRLDGYGLNPEFLMTSRFVKRAPELSDPDDNVENVSHKVKMLESVIVSLADKLSQETRDLKEDSKAIRAEIKSLKPSYASLFKSREEGLVNPRERKRSRVEDDTSSVIDNVEENVARDEVFDNRDGFSNQNRRGFLSGQSRGGKGQQNLLGGQRHPRSETAGGQGEQVGGVQLRDHRDVYNDRRQSWRQRLPNITGAAGDSSFAPPADLFVFNVNKEVTAETIKTYMKDTKGLNLEVCEKVSHPDARTSSFKVQVRAEDYDKAMNGETWPYQVRVRPYRHFRQKHEQGGRFGVSDGRPHGQSNTINHGE